MKSLLERRGLVAWLVLAVGITTTLGVWDYLRQQNERNARQQFDLHAAGIVRAIEKRLHDHEQILRGGAGLFDAAHSVTRQAWSTYVRRLQLQENYPGILGVGYSQLIQPEDLQAHIAAIRAEGFPDYTVKPAGERELYTSIIFLEPFSGRNLAAFGYDMFSQETRQKAMRIAVESGRTSISGKVTLVQETYGRVQAGFLMYVPIYDARLPLTTPEERWQALRGFVYSPYRVEDLMRGILGEQDIVLDYSIHDGAQAVDEALMYSSSELRGEAVMPQSRYAAQRQISSYGPVWTISLFSRPAFEERFGPAFSWVVLLLGTGTSVSLFILTWSLINRRDKALKLAHQMTLHSRENELRVTELNVRFNLAADSAGIGVWEYIPAVNRLFWDDRMCRLYHIEPGEFSGQFEEWRSRVHPDDVDRVLSELKTAIDEGASFDTSYRIIINDDGVRYVKADALLLRDDKGEVTRIIGVNYDITTQRDVEDEIRRSRALLSNVLQSAQDFSIIATDPQGLITIFSRGAERMLGYRADEVIGRQTPAIIHLATEVTARAHALSRECGYPIEGFRVFVEKADRELSEQREWTYVHKDGHHIPVSLVVSAMRDDNGNIVGYIGVAQDITEHKKFESSLREEREKLNEAQRIAKVGSWTLDLRSNALDWSDEIFHIFEIDKNQFAASYEAFIEAIHPDDREMVNQAYLNSLETRQPYDITHRLLFADDRVKYVQERCETLYTEDGTAELSRGTVQDITELTLVQQALQDQVQHTAAILDNAVDGIITIDKRGIVESFNKSAENIFGYQASEVLGRNVNMLMPEPYSSAHDTYLTNYLATGVARIIGIGREVTGRRKDGSTFPMDLAVSEITHNGRPLFIGMVRDITERKRIERMKSEFVSTVSHELRTPLTSIAGALGLLAGGALGTLTAQAQQLIDIAQKNSLRLTHLINDLLDMEKIAAGKMHFEMQVQPLMPLIEQALVANKGYGETYDVSFALTSRVDNVEVRVDTQRMLQILANFMSNAAKFSPRGGTVELAVLRRDGTVRVDVVDHGPGIPEEFRARIFQKFSQADSSDTRQKGGTGLGLAITKELAERMGGRVGFRSVPGQGATFYCEFPLIKSAEADETGDLTAAEEFASCILVVEDEPDIAELLAMMLQRAGYRVDVAHTAQQALTLLREREYVAMTLDLMLPDISGMEVIRRVREQDATASLPIIVVSAKLADGRLAIDGAFSDIDWLPKPLDERKFIAAVEKSVPVNADQRPRVLHVEDDPDLHKIVVAMAGARYDFQLAPTLAEAQTMLALERFDMVILDIRLPDGSGWDLLPALRALEPQPRIVILSGTELTSEEAAKVEAVLQKSHVSPRRLLDALSSRIAASQERKR